MTEGKPRHEQSRIIGYRVRYRQFLGERNLWIARHGMLCGSGYDHAPAVTVSRWARDYNTVRLEYGHIDGATCQPIRQATNGTMKYGARRRIT